MSYPRSRLKINGVSLRDLGFDYPPRTHFQPYAVILDEPTGSGEYVRRGKPRARWTFAELTSAQMETLRGFLQGEESYPVYVTTLKDDGTYATYYGLMRIAGKTWSSGEKWTDVVVEFTRLEEV